VDGFCTIGDLAKSADVPVSTLRYYERVGLLVADGRSDGNYRVYGPAARERLDFIRSAKDAGFTLEDIAELLNIHDGTRAACDEVRVLIERRLSDLEDRLRDMRRLRRTLADLQQTCRASAERDHCLVLDELADGHRPASGR
jgi:MerR family mercuric resistance operon transcriptional regulator